MGGGKTVQQLLSSHEIIYRGNQESVLSSDASIKDLLIYVIQTKKKEVFICEKNKKYLGSVGLRAEDTIRKLSECECVKSLVKVNEKKMIFSHELISNVAKRIYYLNENEFPVIDENGCLLFVWNKMDFYATVCDVKIDEEEITISRGYSSKPSYGMWEKYKYNVNSQNGEDGIIEEILQRIGIESKYCVEFGAWDGEHLSNTKNLIDKYDFQALFIEGDDRRAEDGRKNYRNKEQQVHYAVGYVQHRGNKTLNDFLDEENAPLNIDVMSIDIDGYDYHVWSSLEKYRPRIVCIEYNPSIENEAIVIPPFSEKRFVGASPLALVELGRRKGYSLVAVTECNLIFVVNEEFAKVNILCNDLEVLRKVYVENTSFSTFEGKKYKIGCIENYFG